MRQQFTFNTTIKKLTTDNIQIMPFLKSITSIQLQQYNYFNASNFAFNSNQGSIVSFSLNISYSVIQNFCLSIVLVHFTNLLKYDLYNATITLPSIINSTSATLNLPATVTRAFGLNQVYGPIFN